MVTERSAIFLPEQNYGVPSSGALPSAPVTLGSRTVDRPKESEQGVPRLASAAPRRKENHRQVRIIVISKSEILRAGLKQVLPGDRFCVEGYSTLDELWPEPIGSPPCVLLIRLDNDEVNFSLFHIGQLKGRHGISHIVALSDAFSREDLLSAIEAGVDAYLINNESTTKTLEKTLELVLLDAAVFPHCGDPVLKRDATPSECREPSPKAVTNGVHAGSGPVRSATLSRLSDRERAILAQLALGVSNKHIAREFDITESTVKVHVKNILRKLHVQNRTQAAMAAINLSKSI